MNLSPVRFGAIFGFNNVLSGKNRITEEPYYRLESRNSDKVGSGDPGADAVAFSTSSDSITLVTDYSMDQSAKNFLAMTQLADQMAAQGLINTESANKLRWTIKSAGFSKSCNKVFDGK
jgi:hypothetical protein